MFKKSFSFLLCLLLLTIFVNCSHAKAQILNENNLPATEESDNLQTSTTSQNPEKQNEPSADSDPNRQDFFKAKILDIQNESEEIGLDGLKSYIQTFTVRALDGPWKNRDIKIPGSEFNMITKDSYQKNDVLLISHSKDYNNSDHFVIVDYVREPAIYLLTLIFVGLVILMGRMKGFKAILSLVLSMLVIIYFILPQIIHGANPVITSALGSIFIIVCSLYLTYGLKAFTHLAALSLSGSLLITVLISQWFTDLTKLTGNADEQMTYLSQMLGANFNAKGLLLAGFIIGALGVLDDIVINQISLIEELHKVDPRLTWQKLFQKGLKVGIDHISAIVNSLFLAYVGASLPLLLLFSADTSAQLSFSNTINLEIITTEIVRTLTGSVGLILSVPISTLLAALYFSQYSLKNKTTTSLHNL